ncbi:MAG: lysophospholipid acyltransferase family protein [Gammaproteobacteria bacterium]|nr:MAG: lysophospholipid acyltransferase family protein [Gammaproteobacteria bacterium]
MLLLRSLVFYAGLYLLLTVFTFLVLLTFPLKTPARLVLPRLWARIVIAWLRLICGLDHKVEYSGALPKPPYIILAKHQSAWETIALQTILPPFVFVTKRELKWIPIFGWGLAMTGPISIDRNAGQKALDQVIEQGRERFDEGLCVLVFPEGTRVPVGTKRRYKLGGATLAAATGLPILPIAHNAGLFWPRRSIRKKPGMITIEIGPPIETAGKTVNEINAEAERWIEGRMKDLIPGAIQ